MNPIHVATAFTCLSCIVSSAVKQFWLVVQVVDDWI